MNYETQNEIRPKAVIYCRVSDSKQVTEGNSLSTQERLCREYALKQGYDIAHVFIEKGESAKTKDRTELKKLFAFCQSKKNNVSFVVVYKLDRFSRNTDDYSYLRIRLKKEGISIRSTTEYFENTPAGKFMENIIANVSQFDNDVRTERCVNGSRDAMREGRYVWCAPFGYSNVKVAKKGTIAPNEMAAVVRQTFEEIAKNEYPIEQIRRRMFHAGLMNKQGKPIARSYFYRMIKNEVYAGWIVNFGERHKGLFKPILTDELFEQVQRVLHHRTRKNYSYNTKHPDFPLRRFVKHPTGLKLTGSWNQGKAKKYPYYRFMGKMMNYPKESLENQFRAYMDHFSLNEIHIEALKRELKKALSRGVTYRQKDREKIQHQVNELKERQGALIEKNIQGIINNQILREQLDRIDLQLLELNSKLYIEPNYDVNYDELVDQAEELLKNPSNVWNRANNENRLRLQVFEFPQGVTFDGINFQTPEICRLFKVKDIFLHEKSPNVDVKEKVLKNDNEVSSIIPISGDNYVSKEYWEGVGKELIELNKILKGEYDRNKSPELS